MKKATITSLLLALVITEASAFSLGDAASAIANTTTKKESSTTTQASSNALVGMLSSQLGITDKQATGGLGSILGYAQGSLSDKDYKTLASAVGNADELQAAAPKTDSKTAGISALGSAFGGDASSLGTMATLVSQFSSLDLDSDMISKFIPVIMSYFKSSGSTDAMGILSSLFTK